MKLIFTSLLLVCTLLLFGKTETLNSTIFPSYFPDSIISPDSVGFCVIEYPGDISIANCTEDFQTGYPILDPSCVQNDDFFLVFSDTEIIECEHIQRRWIEYNNILQEIDTFIQNIYIDPNVNIECKFEVEIDVTEGSKELNVSDLLENYDSSINYSFTLNPLDTILLIENELPFKYQQRITNLDNDYFCYTEITKKNCLSYTPTIKDTINLTAHHSFSIYAIDYIEDIDHICDTFDYKIRLVGGSYNEVVKYNSKGQDSIIPLRLRYIVNGTWKTKEVYANLTNLPSDTLIFQLENIYLNAGEEYLIPFTSPNFYDMTSFQFGLELAFGEMLGATNLSLTTPWMNFNLVSDELLLFAFAKVSAFDMSPTDTLFLVGIKPNSDGYLRDFLSLSEEFPFEATRSDFIDVGIRLEFNTGTNTTNTFYSPSEIRIFPNPSFGGILNIEMFDFSAGDLKITLKDLNSQIIHYFDVTLAGLQKEIISLPMDSSIPSGFYFIDIVQNSKHITKKLIIQ